MPILLMIFDWTGEIFFFLYQLRWQFDRKFADFTARTQRGDRSAEKAKRGASFPVSLTI